jgi:hypothetical protein
MNRILIACGTTLMFAALVVGCGSAADEAGEGDQGDAVESVDVATSPLARCTPCTLPSGAHGFWQVYKLRAVCVAAQTCR